MQFLVVTTSLRQARREVLVESLRSSHPEAEVTLLLCDAVLSDVPPAGALLPQSQHFAELRWADLVLALGQREAGWAVVPWMVERMWPNENVIVIDDTFVVLGRLEALMNPALRNPALRNPALTNQPLTNPAPVNPASVLVRAGRVDPATGAVWGTPLPGLVVLPAECDEFTRWWSGRVLAAVRSDNGANGGPLWSTHSAIDYVSDPQYRVTPDTAGDVELSLGPAGEVNADGRPVVLVDFAGFDPRKPWWLPTATGEPSALVSESDGLRRLCRDHAERLTAKGWTPEQEVDRMQVLPGLAVTGGMRSWYRTLLDEQMGDHDGSETAPNTDVGGDIAAAGIDVPNPFVPGELRGFIDLLAGPGKVDGTGVSVHADLVMSQRADLQAAFPQPRWRDRRGFRHWLWTSGLREQQMSLATLPELPRPVEDVRVTGERRPFGVNLIGYLGADLGLGVVARRMKTALETAGVPTAIVSYDRTSSNLRERSDGTVDRPYHFNLIVIVPDQLPLFVQDVGMEFFSGHHNIGLWYWESDTLTAQQESAFDLVDEVWVASQYLYEAFSLPDRVPVTLVPSPLVFDRPTLNLSERARLGLDDRFTFLFSFDFLSVVARKNPLGLVDAYCRAFEPGGGTRLILKSINGSVFPEEKERLFDAIADRDDIELWDRLLSSQDRLALVAAADCYVSLHRSEGLGLTMAEAMAVGTPVIATAYSGNLDFMDDSTALLVPAEEILVGPGNYYPAEGHWAEPDYDHAALLMRMIRDDALDSGELCSRLTTAASASLEQFGYEHSGQIAMDRLVAMWSNEDQATKQ